MARRDTNKAVTAKMYRHFAVVTIVATAALAVATSESNADQLNAGIDSQQAALDAAGKEIGKNAQPKIVRRVEKVRKTPRAASGWGSDEGGGDSGGGSDSGYIPTGINGHGVTPGLLRQLKISPELFYAMTAEEQAKLLAKVNGPQPVSAQEQARRQQVTAAASLARSGFEGSCSDC